MKTKISLLVAIILVLSACSSTSVGVAGRNDTNQLYGRVGVGYTIGG